MEALTGTISAGEDQLRKQFVSITAQLTEATSRIESALEFYAKDHFLVPVTSFHLSPSSFFRSSTFFEASSFFCSNAARAVA